MSSKQRASQREKRRRQRQRAEDVWQNVRQREGWPDTRETRVLAGILGKLPKRLPQRGDRGGR